MDTVQTIDFSRTPDRRGSGSIKWDRATVNELPLWVADMDFAVAPAITEALRERVAHPVFGYSEVQDSFRDAVCAWQASRNGWRIQNDQLMTVPGVIPAMVVALETVTVPGDAVVLITPVYAPFYRAVEGIGRHVRRSGLHVQRVDGRPYYRFDPERLHAAAAGARALILCSPHNPGGRFWSADELSVVAEVAAEHDLVVISDEIHGDLSFPGQRFVPFSTIPGAAERTITLFAPTKTFNIPGLSLALCAIEEPRLRRRYARALHARMLEASNPLSLAAAEAAYRHGGTWLDQLRAYLAENYRALGAILGAELPQAALYRQEGTFIGWVDLSRVWEQTQGNGRPLSVRFVQHAREAGVWVSDGHQYGGEGDAHVRINYGCARATLEEALTRLVGAARTFAPRTS